MQAIELNKTPYYKQKALTATIIYIIIYGNTKNIAKPQSKMKQNKNKKQTKFQTKSMHPQYLCL